MMKKVIVGIRTAVLSAGLVLCGASLAHAQATRTWVSGVGDDVNPCSRTAPCKTFAGAIAKTAAGGFIDALDPAGFGSVTITKSITLDGGGFLAGILTAGNNGIVINGSNIIVHLRNLSIESPLPGGPSAQGVNGVEVINAAEVHIEHCVIASFSNAAVNFHPASGQLFVSDTDIMNNANGGIAVATGRATIQNLHADNCGDAVVVTGAALVTVRSSYAAGSSVGFAAIVNPAAVLNLENVVSTNNTHGVQANGGATVRISNSTIVSNSTTGLLNDGSSTFVSMQGNIVTGNPTNGVFNGTTVTKQ